ncbi:prepilin peptidase [Aeromicrobium sp.]|uniref:prepilin peptidase n=1 Tax=Aeromicrobium sp. TaxID=1871063 RepID=UPI0040344603
MQTLYVVATVVGAGVLGLLGPHVISRLPEPEPDPSEVDEPPKPLYADLARRPRLAPALALVAAVLALVVALGIDEPLLLPAWAVFAGVGTWLSFIDLRTQLLPYALTLPLHVVVLALVGLASLVAQDRSIILKGLIGNLVLYGVFRLIYALGRWISQPFGFGDVRIAGVIGLLLGALGAAETLYGGYAGFILGAVVGLGLYAAGRIGRRDPFAFGPYLVVGAFLGPPLVALLR